MELKATLKRVLPLVERGEFKSKKVWVTTEDDPKYPQTIELEVSGVGIGIFDNVAIGAPVVCHCNLRGREWTNPDAAKNPTGASTVFNTIQCWKCEAGLIPVAQPNPIATVPVSAPVDDLPF